MKKTLDVVKGAVDTNNKIPPLRNFLFYEGRIQGCDGVLIIDTPCPELDPTLHASVSAAFFLGAVEACTDKPELSLDSEKLTVQCGQFKARIPLSKTTDFPRADLNTEGQLVELTAPLLPLFSKLYKFINTGSRNWLKGVLFKSGYAWATNNIVLARIPYELPDTLIPIKVIDELLRIGIEPIGVEIGASWVTFFLPDETWLRCQIPVGDWPDIVNFMPKKQPKNGVDSTALGAAVAQLLPLSLLNDQQVICTNSTGVSTARNGAAFAEVQFKGLPETRWTADIFKTVLDVSQFVDLSTYPNVCYWSGDSIDGVVIGLPLDTGQ